MLKKFEEKKPIFTKGRILKNEMLESLRDFPRHVTEILLESQTEGVISGFDLKVDERHITIKPGIVKYQSEVMVLGTALKIPYTADGSEQVLKLQFQDRYQSADFEGRRVHMVLEKGPIRGNEMELARFRLSQGAYLRSDYQDFEDFKTGHNTLNIVNQPYSSMSGSTLNPAILSYFASALLEHQTANPHDLALIYQVLNQPVSISRALLVNYIKTRLKEADAPMESNADLHQGLVQILKKVISDVRDLKHSVSGHRRLIVD